MERGARVDRIEQVDDLDFWTPGVAIDRGVAFDAGALADGPLKPSVANADARARGRREGREPRALRRLPDG